MKILIVSDTHGNTGNLEKVLKREGEIDFFLHCGDVEGEEDYIEALLMTSCSFVAGNCDLFSSLPSEQIIEIRHNRILLTHGHYYYVNDGVDRLVEAAREKQCNIVCYGHTHRPEIQKIGSVLVLNPGSLSYPRQMPRKPSYIVGTTNGGKISFEIRYL